VLAGVLLVCASAASGPSTYVPGRSGGWFEWIAGPLAGPVPALTPGSFEAYTLLMCVGYGLVLVSSRALSARVLAGAIVAANAILLLGPPLISQDVFGYLSFARMGVLHGLDPYTHVAAQAPTDPIIPFIGWPGQHSPYGPLFTLASYATAPLGLAGGLWTLKAAAVAGSLLATGLTARAAALMGDASPPARWAAAFVGLNPVMLELAVGGAHNDTLVLAFLAGALVLTAGASPRFRAGAVTLAAGVGIKMTAGIALPFLVLAPRRWRERARTGLAALAGLTLVAAIGLIGFGSHALGFLDAVGEQQQLVASHSVPAETARLLGLSGTPSWWRHCYVAGFVVVLLYALWRTARGADWRVAAGWSTLALLASTAWLLPWYAIWPLPLAAVCRDRWLRSATLVFCAYAVLIHLALADPLLKPPRVYGPPRHGHIGALGR
jgi:alpha-1,6-mannosyltransferase